MSLVWKAQPLFISSTFTDMMAERDVLRDFVFPELEERLQERSVHLEPIDLRWGVQTGNAQEQEQKELLVLKVCLNEIDRCKPFFIGLIGDRYGWVPPAQRMQAAESEKGFESTLKDKSVTALEIEYGVLASTEQLQRSFFFFREPLPYDQMPPHVRAAYSDLHHPEIDEELAKTRLDNFKTLIKETVGAERVLTYKADWDGEKVSGLEDFKQQVLERLWRELDEQTKELLESRAKSWQDEERNYLADFIEDRTISFSGREDVIDALKSFALAEAGYETIGLCLSGESGGGKSALFAKLHKELEQKDVFLLAHAAGISLRSNSLTNMLTLWIEELAAHLKLDISAELQEKSSLDDFVKLFSELLSRAATGKRVVILVDALNQFERSPHARHVTWLPELLPANAKFIFTAITGEETDKLAKRSGMRLQELQPINRSDAEKIIDIICSRYHKRLTPKAVSILLEKKRTDGAFAYSNALWLTMAVDEFLLLDEDDFKRMATLKGDAEQKLEQLLLLTAQELPADISEMYHYVFKRSALFGEEFVNAVLSYIGISRNGLRESDLARLMESHTSSEWEPLNFAAFRRYLRNHLVQKGELGLWDFRHVQARRSLTKTVLQKTEAVKKLHTHLAACLESLDEEDPLRLSEILWHLFKCDDKPKAAQIYGSNWWDNDKTGEHSLTLKDILLEDAKNMNWLCDLLQLPGTHDETNRTLINNIWFNLEARIKNDITLKPRLKLLLSTGNTASNLNNRNPESAEYARDVSISYNKIGAIHQALGDTQSALANYQSSLQIREELRRRNPESAEYARDLVVSYHKLQRQDDLKEALLYMKNKNMFMDPPLVNLLEQLTGQA